MRGHGSARDREDTRGSPATLRRPPYGWVGPKGMDPKIVRFLHDAFKKALDDPEHIKVLAQLDQVYWYKSSEEYRRWAADTLQAERATIERVGLLAK